MPIKWKAKDLATLNDMFGEVALTTADAKAYMAAYQQAIDAIG